MLRDKTGYENEISIGQERYSQNFWGKCNGNMEEYRFLLNITKMTGFSENDLTKYLTVNEITHVNTFKSKKRRDSYIYGRYSMKAASSILCKEVPLTNIEITNGVFGYPIININGHGNISGSISHCNTCAAAVAFPEKIIMGIDIEEIDRDIKDTVRRVSSKHELSIIYELEDMDEIGYHILWTAKESLTKCLRTGFTIPIEILEIESITSKNKSFEVLYKNFPHFKACTSIINDIVCTITYPKKLVVSLD